jgi:hypothetical protein
MERAAGGPFDRTFRINQRVRINTIGRGNLSHYHGIEGVLIQRGPGRLQRGLIAEDEWTIRRDDGSVLCFREPYLEVID